MYLRKAGGVILVVAVVVGDLHPCPSESEDGGAQSYAGMMDCDPAARAAARV